LALLSISTDASKAAGEAQRARVFADIRAKSRTLLAAFTTLMTNREKNGRSKAPAILLL
jgi:hypothetical protein